jgi:hypothetical protein
LRSVRLRRISYFVSGRSAKIEALALPALRIHRRPDPHSAAIDLQQPFAVDGFRDHHRSTAMTLRQACSHRASWMLAGLRLTM